MVAAECDVVEAQRVHYSQTVLELHVHFDFLQKLLQTHLFFRVVQTQARMQDDLGFLADDEVLAPVDIAHFEVVLFPFDWNCELFREIIFNCD